jgi:predicted nucleotidyltransferase component of viral defense system
MIKEWLDSYQPQNQYSAENALREIMQEVALAGLYRAHFFKYAAFYGGTALRIFHGLNRFSEDLDFSLLAKNPEFKMHPFLQHVEQEFDSVGLKVSIAQKQKSFKTAVDSAFLKSETLWSELVLENTIPQLNLKVKPSIKIKLEVDTQPALPFETEQLLLLKPFSFYVNCFTLPDLFAGKMHALLFRKWKNRVKGRDWYDMEWYIRKGVPLNLQHFTQRAKESGDWSKDTVTVSELRDMLAEKITSVNMEQVKVDVLPFIPNPLDLHIWSTQYFLDLMKHLKVQE